MLSGGDRRHHQPRLTEPSSYDASTTPRVLTVLSCVLEKLVARNDQLSGGGGKSLSAFHGVRSPAIGLDKYVERIYKYTSCSPSCFVVAFVYIDRLLHRYPDSLVVSLNVHRLLVTSVMIASKILDDESPLKPIQPKEMLYHFLSRNSDPVMDGDYQFTHLFPLSSFRRSILQPHKNPHTTSSINLLQDHHQKNFLKPTPPLLPLPPCNASLAIVRVSPDFATLLGLQQKLTPSRNNGFLNMLKLMQKIALQLYVAAERGASPSSGVSGIGDSTISDGGAGESELGGDLREDLGGNSELGSRGRRIEEILKELRPTAIHVEDISYQHAGHSGVAGSDGETHFN
ncbi:uncharacterized protein LOC121809281 isoform X1 [Salvia splendens]|uniref:uncharacterized protein LOC121809281 isoform X1 n=1 Tax=Salvia splendens TaxID=180675 RepID=UPI001C26CE10|nr:uncharacterized protein LOC121809281 isoform X1 [Salvia splendens]XP_042065749.1 uncharacterized protein LOC121809281 isoform X1 [Salvia splendens]